MRTVIAAGDEVLLAIADAADDGDDGWQPSLRRFATSTGVQVRTPATINDPAFVAEIGDTRPDFLLSFQAAQLLKAPLLEAASMGSLNLHFGPLPRYRGVAPIAWALINGETATGVTLHHIDLGVDNGPIISARTVPIDPNDTGRTLYDKSTAAGIELFKQSWPSVRREVPAGTTQSEHSALYYNRHSIDFSRRAVTWEGDCETIANRARAFIFPPFQYPLVTLGRIEVEVGSVGWDRLPHRGRPGEILSVAGDTLTVAAPGGRITFGQLRLDGANVPASEFGRRGIVVGARCS